MRVNIIESIRSLFNSRIRTIENNPLSIVMIDNPSEKELAAAIQKNSKLFLLIKEPSERLCSIAVNNNPSYIRFINNPSESLQLQAISKNPSAIAYIRNPCNKAQLKVVSTSPESIRLIETPSIEAVKLYIADDYSRLWNLNVSKEKQMSIFSDIFQAKQGAWNISNDEFIVWLSNYTNVKEETVKEVYNAVKALGVDKINIKQWNELLTTGKCKTGAKELIFSQEKGRYSIKIKSKNNHEINAVQENNTKNKRFESPQLEHLRECITGTKKKINESDILTGLKENNISLENMSNEQISQLIRSGETSINNQIIKLKKEPSGYKIKIEEKQVEQSNITVKELPKMQLQETQDNVDEIKLSDKQLKEIEKKGFANIPGGKIIRKIQTPAGYTFKVYNVINTLTRQGQAEA